MNMNHALPECTCSQDFYLLLCCVVQIMEEHKSSEDAETEGATQAPLGGTGTGADSGETPAFTLKVKQLGGADFALQIDPNTLVRFCHIHHLTPCWSCI
jgi:hypothetical protein